MNRYKYREKPRYTQHIVRAQSLQAPPTGHAWTSYYFAGSARIAMRVQVNGSDDQVYYLLADHLGSTMVSFRSDGGETRYQSYKPWGELRGSGNSFPTDRTYTGQRWSGSIGLSFFNARWLDSSLGRFAQADTIIPSAGYSGDWDRYAAMRNNPLKFVDPSGHKACEKFDESGRCEIVDKDWQDDKQPGLPDLSNIPDPQLFPCANNGSKVCLSSSDDSITQITHTIFGEGGSLSKLAAADVLQTILNRAYIYWTTHHVGINPMNIPWQNITQEQLTDLFLFILSEPYAGSDTNLYPAFNAWGEPEPHAGIYWDDEKVAIEIVLYSPGLNPNVAPINIGGFSPQDAIRNNVNVIYYASKPSYWEPPVPWVAVDAVPETRLDGPLIWQYYSIFPINP